MRLAVPILTLVVFTVWSLLLVHDEQLAGLFTLLRDNDWGRQVFGDLSVALTIAWIALAKDRRGTPLWPYVLITPSIGSPALLLFIIHRELRAR